MGKKENDIFTGKYIKMNKKVKDFLERKKGTNKTIRKQGKGRKKYCTCILSNDILSHLTEDTEWKFQLVPCNLALI